MENPTKVKDNLRHLMAHIAKLGFSINQTKCQLISGQCIQFLRVQLNSRNMTASLTKIRAQNFDHVNQDKNRQIGQVPHVVKACGYADRGGARGQIRHAEPKTLPTLADWEMSVSQNSEVHLSEGNISSVAVAKTLAQQGVSHAGGHYGSTACEKGNHYYRCQFARLGRCLATNGCEGNLEKNYPVPTHQLPRTESSVPNTSLEPIESQACADTIRQRVVVLNKSSGWYEVIKLLQAAHELWVWADTHLSSLRAIHIPGHLNKLADALSRSAPRAGEWQLHPEIVQLIWNTYGAADVDCSRGFSQHNVRDVFRCARTWDR